MSAGVLTVEGLLGVLEQANPSSPFFRGAAEVLDSHLLQDSRSAIMPTRRGPKRFLTIGMATHNDFDGVFFSVQALRLYHPEITDDTEILVLDNDPRGPSGPALKCLEDRVQGYRYYPYDRFQGTTVKDLLFREASGEYVLVMDSHVLFPPGSLARFIEFLKHQHDSRDLWQGPLLSDGLKPLATHFNDVWSGGMHGQWAWDERAADPNAPPFEIPTQGMGVFACRRAAWPGFNPRFQGFCCEEGYIHEKIRRNGGTPMCLPFLRWLHRFERPGGIPYKPIWADRIRNFLIGYDELRLDPTPVVEHFEATLGAEGARPMIEATMREIAGPFYAYDAVFAVDGDPAQHEKLLGTRVRRIAAPQTPMNPEIGRVLAHRGIVVEAKWQSLQSVLVIDGDLRRGIAYEAGAFDRFLEDVPETPAIAALWLRKQGTLEAFGRSVRIDGHNDLPIEHQTLGHRVRVAKTFGIEAFGTHIAVIADCEQALATLERYLLPPLPRISSDIATAEIVVRVVSDGTSFQIFCGDFVELAPDLRALAVKSVRLLDEAIVKRLTNLTAVHAGAVELCGQALLLPGGSHAGKSALVAELLRRGALYLSDEYALIDAVGRAHPYPRPLLLRNGSPEQIPCLPDELDAKVGRLPVPVGWILALEYDPAAHWRISAVPQSEALLILLRNTPHALADTPRIVAPLKRASATSTCYTGTRERAADAAEHILRIIGG
jgi:hypothetical protein